MLKRLEPNDTPAAVEVAAGTGFFKPYEVETLREVLDDYHGGNEALDHHAFGWFAGGELQAFSYHAPAAMTDRAWCLYWIAVRAGLQGRGIGRALLDAVEADIAGRDGRLLVVETSSTDHYAPTRKFYERCGYAASATIPDYYADGDGMVVFTKRVHR